jgi:hypothetical protein
MRDELSAQAGIRPEIISAVVMSEHLHEVLARFTLMEQASLQQGDVCLSTHMTVSRNIPGPDSSGLMQDETVPPFERVLYTVYLVDLFNDAFDYLRHALADCTARHPESAAGAARFFLRLALVEEDVQTVPRVVTSRRSCLVWRR